MYFQANFQRAFGTFPLQGEELELALECALHVGYRAFDTAQLYANERETGQLLRASGIAREDLCITTKVPPDKFAQRDFLASVEESLFNLQVDYVDVLLLHWPPADGNIQPPLLLLQQAYDRGYARHIGISNYNCKMMRQAAQILDVKPITNQVEFHPLLDQEALLACSRDTGIPLAAYCPVARGKVVEHPLFSEIAETYRKSASQVALRWILQKGVSINIMSTNPRHILSNYHITDFNLSPSDMSRIDELTHTGYRVVTEQESPWAPVWDT